MNNDQLTSLVTKLIVAVCAAMAAKYGFSTDLPGIAATVAPLLVALAAGWYAHQKAGNAVRLAVLWLLPTLLLTGCTFQQTSETKSITAGPTGPVTNMVTVTRARIWEGFIVEHSDTLFGADVESPSGQNNGTVKMKVGFGNTYTRYTPTSTNVIYAPKYVTSLGIHQTLATSTISGESASGDTFYTATNGSAGASVPGTPSPQQVK